MHWTRTTLTAFGSLSFHSLHFVSLSLSLCLSFSCCVFALSLSVILLRFLHLSWFRRFLSFSSFVIPFPFRLHFSRTLYIFFKMFLNFLLSVLSFLPIPGIGCFLRSLPLMTWQLLILIKRQRGPLLSHNLSLSLSFSLHTFILYLFQL